MLSDEDRKAIDIIKNEIKAFETVITAMEKEIDDKDWLRKNILEIKEDILVRKTLLNLIDKQSKEIEELKENNKNLEDELNKYIVKMTDEQYRRLVNIIRDEINKLWEDKIKAKIEEWQKEKEFYDKDEDREWGQYNNWDWINTFINEMQSLLEKE